MFNMFSWKYLLNFITCYATDPGDPPGGEGDDEDTPTADTAKIAALEKSLEDMTNIVTTVVSGQTALQTSLAQLAEAIKAGPAKPDEDEDDEVPTSDDLETMTREQLIAHIQGGTKKLVDAALKPILERISNTDGKLDNAITSVEVEKFHTDHKDLMEWRTEIGELLKSNRATNVADAYTLARSNNPEKVKVVDAKYGPPQAKKVEFKGSFAGFPGKTASGGENKRMTMGQAAAAAWDDATAKTPGIEQFLSNDSTN